MAVLGAWSFERRLVSAAVAAWIAIAIATLLLGAPLGHDEAAFAVSARGDAPPEWVYRSPGVIALARLGLAAGGADWQVRLPVALVNAGVVLAVFALGRAVFGAVTGAWAAAIIAGAHWMVLRSAELLGDLPAVACVLAGLAVVASELERASEGGDRPRWRLALAAPLFAGAFYVRYGSTLVIALAGGAALALWWRSILRRPGPVIATVALFAALLIPHVVDSLARTGSALGILQISRATPYRVYVGDGLVTYLTSNPFVYYGALVAPVALAGLIGIVRARRRAALYLWLVAVGQIVVLGLQNHGQPRYVFIATALLVVLGVDAVRALVSARVSPGRHVLLRRCALGLVVATWLGAAIAVVPLHRTVVRRRAPFVTTAETVRRDAAGASCRIDARRVPQLAWYSGCTPVAYGERTFEQWPLDRREYVVSMPDTPIDIATIATPSSGVSPVELPAPPGVRLWRLAR